MCACFCIEFIDFMFTGKSLTDFTNLFLLYQIWWWNGFWLSFLIKYKNEWSNLENCLRLALKKIKETGYSFFIADINDKRKDQQDTY